MTRRDQDVLAAIISLRAKNGFAPTLREIGAAVGLSSKATVHVHLESLKRTGKITWMPGAPRTIVVVEGAA